MWSYKLQHIEKRAKLSPKPTFPFSFLVIIHILAKFKRIGYKKTFFIAECDLQISYHLKVRFIRQNSKLGVYGSRLTKMFITVKT